MLQYVRYSCIIRRICFETNGEDIIFIFSGYMQIVCAGLVVLQMQSCQLEFWDMFRSDESEAMELLPGFWILGELCDCFSDDSFGCVP